MDVSDVQPTKLRVHAPREAGSGGQQVCKVAYDGGRLLVQLPPVKVLSTGPEGSVIKPCLRSPAETRGMLQVEQALMQLVRERCLDWELDARKLAHFKSCVYVHPEHGTCLRCKFSSHTGAVLREGRVYELRLHVRGVRIAKSTASLVFAVDAWQEHRDDCMLAVAAFGADSGDEANIDDGEDADVAGPDEAELREHVRGELLSLSSRFETDIQAMMQRQSQVKRLLALLPTATLSEVIRTGDLLPDI